MSSRRLKAWAGEFTNFIEISILRVWFEMCAEKE